MAELTQQASALFLRLVLGFLGVFCLYVATLYEDQEGRLDSKLQHLWEQLRATEKEAVNRHGTFIQKTAELVSTWLDGVYGDRLLSFHAISMSLLLWLAVVCLLVLGVYFRGLYVLGSPTAPTLSGGQLILILFVGASSVQGFVRSFRIPQSFGAESVSITWILILLALGVSAALASSGLLSFLIVCGSIATVITIDLAAVMGLRKVVRRAGSSADVRSQFNLFSGSMLIVAWISVSPTVALMYQAAAPDELKLFFIFTVVGAFVSGFPAITFLALLLTLLLHRTFWPTLLRPLYAIRRHKIYTNNKKWFVMGGGYLLIAALWPGINPKGIITELLRNLLSIDLPK